MLPSPPHPQVPPCTQLECSCSQATCSRQDTMAHPVPCWDTPASFPNPCHRFFWHLKLFQVCPACLKQTKVQESLGENTSLLPFNCGTSPDDTALPPNSQMAIPLHSCSKINCVQHTCNPHLLKITNTLVYVHIVIVCITPKCPLYIILLKSNNGIPTNFKDF